MTERRRNFRDLFETRSHRWRAVGLASQLQERATRRARVETVVLAAVLAGVIVVFDNRVELLGRTLDAPARVFTAIALLILGWWIAIDVGRSLGPLLMRRMEPGTAGTVGFLVRLVTVAAALLGSLHVAGVDPRTLAIGGAFTAVVFGLAAQQTLGNLIAGTVLLSARPFTVGERVRLQGGAIGGRLEGVVSSLGLMYTTLSTGEDSVLVPNNVVLSVSVTPLREPESVTLRARLRPGVTPGELQTLIERALNTPIRSHPSVTLEELDGDQVVVRIAATPQSTEDGPQLAAELLEAVSRETRAAS